MNWSEIFSELENAINTFEESTREIIPKQMLLIYDTSVELLLSA